MRKIKRTSWEKSGPHPWIYPTFLADRRSRNCNTHDNGKIVNRGNMYLCKYIHTLHPPPHTHTHIYRIRVSENKKVQFVLFIPYLHSEDSFISDGIARFSFNYFHMFNRNVLSIFSWETNLHFRIGLHLKRKNKQKNKQEAWELDL